MFLGPWIGINFVPKISYSLGEREVDGAAQGSERKDSGPLGLSENRRVESPTEGEVQITLN